VTPTKILLVEDERSLRDGLRERLEREGYRVSAVATLADGIAALSGGPDLVILDRRLPDGEGLQLLSALRDRPRRPPVIVLSARGMPEDRVEGLEGGADDYVAKPFHLRELLARVRAVLARGDAPAPALAFGEFSVDEGARVLRRGRREIPLARLEFELLLYFARHPGRAIARKELLDRVWGYDRYPTTRTVDFHVQALRRKTAERHFVTVHGVGYRFEP